MADIGQNSRLHQSDISDPKHRYIHDILKLGILQ
jgi:hypothetical protein